jgi:hypothetical protein
MMSTPNTNPLTYNGYVTQVATLAVVNTTTLNSVVVGVDAAFNNIIPQMLNYAELRIQRDLDLLNSRVVNTSYSLSASNPVVALSVNDFVTLQTVGVVSGTVTTPLLPATKEFLQSMYPDTSYTATPKYFAMYSGDSATVGSTTTNILVGPIPDSSYPLVIIGTMRMPSLYEFSNTAQAGTSTTLISTFFPDLLLMASMIYISAYQRNFGRQADDPQMAQSYENQYKTLLSGATIEEFRKKFEMSGWSSNPQAPATPSRG